MRNASSELWASNSTSKADKGRSGRKLPPNAGKGRRAGVPNRLNANIRRMVLEALNSVGGEAYLAEQAIKNPTAFLALLSKLIPRDNPREQQPALKLNVVTNLSNHADFK